MRHVEADWTVFFLYHKGMRRAGSSRSHAVCVEIEQQPQSGIRFAMAPPSPRCTAWVWFTRSPVQKRTNLEGLISTSMLLSMREGL